MHSRNPTLVDQQAELIEAAYSTNRREQQEHLGHVPDARQSNVQILYGPQMHVRR